MEAAYGTWTSPISAADLVDETHPVNGACLRDDGVWCSEMRPSESGRTAVLRDGTLVLPAPWNARSRVHEYGGTCWTVTPDGSLVFTEFADQRLYLMGDAGPRPLTPESSCNARYAEPVVVDGEVWCVRERHEDGLVVRDVCAVPLDGSAVDDAGRIRSLVGGSDFLAYPRLSPDGKSLVWIAWDHPNMPWDGTELRIAERQEDGSFGPARRLLGGPTESLLQPEWTGPTQLTVSSDRTGWWNLYSLDVITQEVTSLCEEDAEYGGPLWELGALFHATRSEGSVIAVRTLGTEQLVQLGEGQIDLGAVSTVSLLDVRDDKALVVTAGDRLPAGLRLVDLGTRSVEDVRLFADRQPPVEYLPTGESRTFTAERDVHVTVFPPHNPDFTAPEGELPPYLAYVHGGPTGRAEPHVDHVKAFFTSRGIGLVFVDYGGSSGYGRAYRERLRGQWGIVDVEDTVAAMRGLVDAGLADPARLAIKGGSAGGWTVLAALTGTDVFACGASYYGVSDLRVLALDTHDFESRYLDGLVGPLPESEELYVQRAPLSHVDELDCPVLLLQGLEDPVVPPAQAEVFRDAMVAKGIPHAYRAYEGEGHGFRRAENVIDAREAELSFYGQVMGFEPPGVPVLELWRP